MVEGLPLTGGGELVPRCGRVRLPWGRPWDRLTADAGLSWVTPHTLRHTFASQAVMAGVPIYTVSHWLGHASLQTTQIYAHLSPQQDLMDLLPG